MAVVRREREQSGNNKWVEYADSISWMFNFVPGDLFWIKTKTPTVLHLGSGVTTPLTQPSKIVLAPGALSDVALPFDFSIRVGDIIDSTNSDSEKAQRAKGIRCSTIFSCRTARAAGV